MSYLARLSPIFSIPAGHQNLEMMLGDLNPEKSRPYGESHGPF
jgi:hypothetical protein